MLGEGVEYWRLGCLIRVELQEAQMTFSNIFGRPGRTSVVSGAILGLLGIAATPRPAHAVDPGAAVGIGLGAFAAGTALGAAANPNYNPYYRPYGYYAPPAPAYVPAPGYYPPSAYYQPRSCWDPYYRRYYAC
jgi:hypothetical protein